MWIVITSIGGYKQEVSYRGDQDDAKAVATGFRAAGYTIEYLGPEEAQEEEDN